MSTQGQCLCVDLVRLLLRDACPPPRLLRALLDEATLST
jgi:hypothetical protein